MHKIEKDVIHMHSSYFENMSKTKRLLLEITCIGVLSALSYVGVMINIPIPSPLGRPLIHLGNLIVIISALIFGGLIGGISGSIGMGLYDLIAGYDAWSIARTIILKFVMGVVVGLIYHRLIKKEKRSLIAYQLIIGSIFLFVGIVFLVVAIQYQGVWISSSLNKKATIYWPIYSFSILIGIILMVGGIFSKKLSYHLQCALLSTSSAIVVNLIGEFIYKLMKQMTLGGTNFVDSNIIALFSVPATLLNGVITLVLVIFVFLPIKLSLDKSRAC